jgi:hypothetical protein
MGEGALPASFDAVYFSTEPWSDRVTRWVAAAPDREFARGNETAARQAISDDESGLRVVVNIGTHALLKLLPAGRYLNLYERPVVGGARQAPSQQRISVDTALGMDGRQVYFAAVALGGVGVRYYGEYCLVLRLEDVDADPQLFDRDSYDILLPPFCDLPDPQVLIDRLVGRWTTDRHAMVLLRVLPELAHSPRLVTTGTISETVLKDQEFIEVHLQPGHEDVPGGFGREDLLELRESPDEVAVATRLRERSDDGLVLTDVEDEWLLRRECVTRVVSAAGLPARVVTQHGRGYQWK